MIRTPAEFLNIGVLLGVLGAVAFALDDVGELASVVLWATGAVMAQIGIVAWGVKVGLRARDDELQRS